MKNPDEKTIDDPKVSYLVRTLSRTNRKDYENYVVNAIWNRLNDDKIEIVTQQYIYDREKRKHYFIDLYFPGLNIGIECDEAHHKEKKNVKSDKERDDAIYKAHKEYEAYKNRPPSLYELLHKIDNQKIDNNEEYMPIRIDVTKTYEEVERQIDKAVKDILERKRKKNKLDEWKIQTAEEYYKEKDEIKTDDKVSFKTITDACNILFSTEYEGQQHAFFYPQKRKNGGYIFENSIYKDHRLWFPKLAIPDPNDAKKMISPIGKKWINELKNNGKELIERDKDKKTLSIPDDNEKERIVFAYFKDPLGNVGYKFVGIFKFDELVNKRERHYLKKKDGDICKIKQYIYK